MWKSKPVDSALLRQDDIIISLDHSTPLYSTIVHWTQVIIPLGTIKLYTRYYFHVLVLDKIYNTWYHTLHMWMHSLLHQVEMARNQSTTNSCVCVYVPHAISLYPIRIRVLHTSEHGAMQNRCVGQFTICNERRQLMINMTSRAQKLRNMSSVWGVLFCIWNSLEMQKLLHHFIACICKTALIQS